MKNQAVDTITLYSDKLEKAKNIILRGAPGTGKSYLAKEIALNIVRKGYGKEVYSKFSKEEIEQIEKNQIEFVQFHPSYDYTDFIEGLRPVKQDDGSISFELKNGIFKEFINKAITNFENSTKKYSELEQTLNINEALSKFLEEYTDNKEKSLQIKSNTKFFIEDSDDTNIYINIPSNITNGIQQANLKISIKDLIKILSSEKDFEKVKDISDYFDRRPIRHDSYSIIIYKTIKKIMKENTKDTITKKEIEKEKLPKNYVFIIDEINRGEISKILGELFFSIDPSYRGKKGAVSTQYSNMHEDPDDKLYIPDNVYIIGTMNDIDRSVDSFDFAMRRRFRFIEISANDDTRLNEVIDSSKIPEDKRQEVKDRLKSLNLAIEKTDGLNKNYQIGPSYFLKLEEIDFDDLWNDYLEPLLREYVQGMVNEEDLMNTFKQAYNIEHYKN